MPTINAASCSVADVTTAINAAADGDTVAIPAGSCTWVTGISMSLTKSLTIQGAGALCATTGGASTTGSDLTTITDHMPAVGHTLLNFSVQAGKLLRITGIFFKQDGGSTTTQNGVLKIAGSTNGLRIDHCHFVSNPDSTMTIQVNSNSSNALTGVIDHNYFDSAVGNGPFGVYLQHGVGTGDAAWAAADGFGTANFLFIEDNRWRNGYLGDANTGGQRFVFRYNTMVAQVNDSVPTVGYCANHGLTSGRSRSSRAMEYYGNNCSALAPGLNKSPFPINGGTAMVWGNTISQYRYCTALDYTRKNNNTYPYGTPPTGWGNCNGVSGTVWDGGGGTIGMDQPGRGMGQLLSGATIATTVNTSTGTQAWPNQARSPIYVWGNNFSPAGYSPTPVVANAASPMISANREYYSSEGAVAGQTGVASGLRSARPATAVTGVGYWATDEQILYVASATNVWSAYYTPYTYPYPLAAATPTVTLNPGDNVQAAVNANPGATTFQFNPGTYLNQQIVPKSGNRFVGQSGVVLDGQGSTQYAFYSNNLHQVGVTITGLEIKRYSTPLTAFGAITGNDVTDWIVTDCIVHDNADCGIRAGTGTGWQLLRNICYSNGRNGITGYQCDGAIISENECYANGAGTGMTQNGGMKILGSADLEITDNNVHDNTGLGIWSDTNYSTTTITGNTVTNNTKGGIWHEVSYTALIAGNTCTGNGQPSVPITGWIDRAGIQITNSPNVEITDNVVNDNAMGITAMYSTGYAASGPEGTYIVQNLNVHDNAVQMQTGKTGLATNTGNLNVFTSLNNHFEGNDYRVTTLTGQWFVWGA